MSWVIATTVRPDRVQASTIPPTRRTPGPSCPVVGSSRTRTAGSIASTLARATSLRSDRSRSYGLTPRDASSPTAASAAVTARPTASGARPRLRGPKATSRSTDRSNSWSSGFWKTNPTAAARRWTGTSRMSAPSSVTRPPVGRSSPLRCLTRVVLPDPFWPTIATDSPGLDDERHPAQRIDAGRVAMGQVLDGDPGARTVGRGRPARDRIVGVASRGRARRRPSLRRPPRARPGRARRPRRPRRRPSAGRARPPRPGGRGSGPSARSAPSRSLPSARPGTSSATIRPPSRRRHRSRPPRMPASCSAHRIAVPSPASSASSAETDAVPAGSSCAVGSSSTR